MFINTESIKRGEVEVRRIKKLFLVMFGNLLFIFLSSVKGRFRDIKKLYLSSSVPMFYLNTASFQYSCDSRINNGNKWKTCLSSNFQVLPLDEAMPYNPYVLDYRYLATLLSLSDRSRVGFDPLTISSVSKYPNQLRFTDDRMINLTNYVLLTIV